MKKSNKDPAPIFDNNIAKNFVNELFDSIQLSKSVEDLQLIPKKIKYGSHLEKRMPDKRFPRLRLRISKEEVNILKQIGILTEDMLFSTNMANGKVASGKMSALEKLLYSVLWKNGDLGKEHHLLNGIVGNSHPGKFGAVFNEFGGYLAGQHSYILDQHTLRCFAVYVSSGDGITDARCLEQIYGTNPQHVEWINYYKAFYQEISKNLMCEKSDFLYYVDRLLFGSGKLIKLKKGNIL
ncbi:MAG: hypothetical protein NT035_00760 [Burkholderiales bacterium]|nr:hypothetical protein [Burkholderiales bacterium]